MRIGERGEWLTKIAGELCLPSLIRLTQAGLA